MYLLDTDILINLMKGAPPAALVARLASVPAEEQFTSTIAVGELMYGARRLRKGTDTLLERLESVLLPNLPVLPFDADAARKYGELRAELEVQGILAGDAELRIGAIALARGLTVVTGNARRFQRIPGLVAECWLEEPEARLDMAEHPPPVANQSERRVSAGGFAIELSLRGGSPQRQDESSSFVPDPRSPYGWLPQSSGGRSPLEGGGLSHGGGGVASSEGVATAHAERRQSDQQVRKKGRHYTDLDNLAFSP